MRKEILTENDTNITALANIMKLMLILIIFTFIFYYREICKLLKCLRELSPIILAFYSFKIDKNINYSYVSIFKQNSIRSAIFQNTTDIHFYFVKLLLLCLINISQENATFYFHTEVHFILISEKGPD